MLLRGGNAADASVAVLAALHVVEPMMSAASGNGFFTIYDRATDRVYSLNGTGAAPLALDASEVTDDELSEILEAIVAGFGQSVTHDPIE
jgi:gamma-glutamyltranspeptidase/glutathione hydrolase